MSLNKRGLIIFGILIIFSLLLQSCRSQVPLPVTYPFGTQQKMQAIKHWDILANEVADNVKAAVDGYPGMDMEPVFIKPIDADTPFGQLFYNLLRTRLVERGLILAPNNQGTLALTYDAEILHHSDRIIRTPGLKYSVLAAGGRVAREAYDWATEDILNLGLGIGVAADLARGYTTGESKPAKELLITTSLDFGGRYIMHDTQIYYFNQKDWWHYDKTPMEPEELPEEIEVAVQPEPEPEPERDDRTFKTVAN